MTHTRRCPRSAAAPLALALLLLGAATCPALAAEAGLAAKLQPFVDSNTLAGGRHAGGLQGQDARRLGAVGFADIAALKAHADGQHVLDRLHDQAHHRRRRQ